MNKPPQMGSPERVAHPTSEDVRAQFERITGDRNYTDVRQMRDAEGLYLWDVKVKTEDGHKLYEYMRKGEYKQGKAAETAIHVTYFGDDDMPISRHLVARYIDGKWHDTP